MHCLGKVRETPSAANMLVRVGAAITCLLIAGAAALFRVDTKAKMSLETVHAEHPLDTEVSIELGLNLERTGRFAQAEDTFLEAARYDHRYQPAWTLANFYFRQNEPDQFWRWAHRAAERSYDDGLPLLRLATELEDDPSVVTNRLGRRPALLRTYLDILIGQNRKGAALQVASMLADLHDPADAPRFEALSKRYGRTK